MLDPDLFRRLNNIRYHERYDDYVRYLKVDELPAKLNSAQRRRFVESMRGFEVANGSLVYVHSPEVRLRVLREAEIPTLLEKTYDSLETGAGRGIQRFWESVSSRYLGVSRARVAEFLRSNVPYQLTRRTAPPRNPSKEYTRPRQAWSCDLIDVSNLAGSNAGWSYIFSCMDLFTKQCWLRKIKKKSAVHARNALATFLSGDHKPKLMLSDNGTEFAGEFKQYLTEHGVRVVYGQSHTPLAHIENLNGQVRKLMAEVAVRTRSKVWHTHLKSIEDNLNQYNAGWRQVEKRDHAAMNKLSTRLMAPPARARYAVGDRVRVKQAAFLSEVRKKMKAGLGKEIYVRYGVLVYTVRRVISRNRVNGHYSYELSYKNGNPVQRGGVVQRYRESDLQAVPESTRGEEMSAEESNRLNRI